MCAGAIINARIPRVVFGAHDPKSGAVHSLFNLLQDARLNHRCEIKSDVLAAESSALLTSFFTKLRKNGKK
jgi:tRNA(adenine34) deaminase